MVTKHHNGIKIKIIDFGLSKKLDQDTLKTDMRQLTNLLFNISISTKEKEATPKFWELIKSYGHFQTVDTFFNVLKKDIKIKKELQIAANQDTFLKPIIDALYSREMKMRLEKT